LDIKALEAELACSHTDAHAELQSEKKWKMRLPSLADIRIFQPAPLRLILYLERTKALAELSRRNARAYSQPA
jgi:hypothetical protein